MKKIYILLYFISITFFIHPDKLVKINLEDFNLNGKVKTYTVINHNEVEGGPLVKTKYHFDKNGRLYKEEEFWEKKYYYFKKYIYSENGLLLKTETYDKNEKLVQIDTYEYDETGTLTKMYVDSKYRSIKYIDLYDYNSEKQNVTVKRYSDNKDHNKTILINYYKAEFENNNIAAIYKYSTKMKLKEAGYFTYENNKIIKIEHNKVVGDKYKIYKIIINKYQNGIFDNPLIMKTYEKIGKKIEKFLYEVKYQYEYY